METGAGRRRRPRPPPAPDRRSRRGPAGPGPPARRRTAGVGRDAAPPPGAGRVGESPARSAATPNGRGSPRRNSAPRWFPRAAVGGQAAVSRRMRVDLVRMLKGLRACREDLDDAPGSGGTCPRRAGRGRCWCPWRCTPRSTWRSALGPQSLSTALTLTTILLLEVLADVQAEVLVRRPGEAVVADHAVGHEVPVPVVMSNNARSRPSGSTDSTFNVVSDLKASPSIERLREVDCPGRRVRETGDVHSAHPGSGYRTNRCRSWTLRRRSRSRTGAER